jgi:hypothetical protein
MKKQMKKLVLAKETVKSLGDLSIEQIAGAVQTNNTACEWSGYATCATCRTPCGTRLC